MWAKIRPFFGSICNDTTLTIRAYPPAEDSRHVGRGQKNLPFYLTCWFTIWLLLCFDFQLREYRCRSPRAARSARSKQWLVNSAKMVALVLTSCVLTAETHVIRKDAPVKPHFKYNIWVDIRRNPSTFSRNCFYTLKSIEVHQQKTQVICERSRQP